MFRTNRNIFILAFSSAFVCMGAIAVDKEEVNQAITKMCDKTVQCMTQSMDDEGIPESMRSMVINQFSQQCLQIVQVDSMPIDKNLNKKALACIDAMSNTSCEDLLDDIEIPACEEYNQLAESFDS